MALLGYLLALAARGQGAPLMAVHTSAEAKQVRVELAELPEISTRLLEIVDPATGDVLRTLWAERTRSGNGVTVTEALKLAPGKYKLRYRDGLALEYADNLAGPANGKWTNPCDILFTPDAIFVMEAGVYIGEVSEEVTRKRKWVLADGRGFTGSYYRAAGPTVAMFNQAGAVIHFRLDQFTAEDQKLLKDLEGKRIEYQAEIAQNGGKIWKLSRDGKVDPAFGDAGHIQLWQDRHADTRSFAIGSDGKIFTSSTYHEALAYGPDGKRLKLAVGGWDNNPYGPRCTGWVNTLAMGPGDRLYFPTAYGMLRVYDATKPGFTGLLYSLKMTEEVGLSPCLTLDGTGNLYMVAGDNSITKYHDDGKAITRLWNLPAPGGVARLTAPSFSKGLLWVADHGPSKGPFWDSGGGGEVLLFWDDGKMAHFIERFGKPGDADDKPEFMDPSSVRMTPDHLGLWVVEDGFPYAEGPRGGARIRKFHVKAEHTEEAELDLSGWK